MENWRQQIQCGDTTDLRSDYEEARHQISVLQEEIEKNNQQHQQLEDFLRKELASSESLVKLQEELLQEIGSDGQKYTEDEVRELLESVMQLKEQLELLTKEIVHKEDQLELLDLELKATKEREDKLAQRLEKALMDVRNTMITVEKQQELIHTLKDSRGVKSDEDTASLEENKALRQQLLDISVVKEEQADELVSLRKALGEALEEIEATSKKQTILMDMVTSQEDK